MADQVGHDKQVFGLLFAACDVQTLSTQEHQQYTKDAMTTKWDRESAANLKKLGVPPDIIAEATGLSPEEIEAL